MFPWADLATVHVTNGLIRRATPISYPALSWARRLSISHGFKVNRNGPCLQKLQFSILFSRLARVFASCFISDTLASMKHWKVC